MNKDKCFHKDDQYVFYLLWKKEIRELTSGVFNLLKGTRQHAIPVGEFVDRVSKNEEEIEANLSTVFQNMHGSNQYWYLRCSEVLCMVREHGPPTLFLTLSCAEYNSLVIATYLTKVNNVSDSYPIGKLCAEDPISVSRKFSEVSRFLQPCHFQRWSSGQGGSLLLQEGVSGKRCTTLPHPPVDRRCPSSWITTMWYYVDPGENHLPHPRGG